MNTTAAWVLAALSLAGASTAFAKERASTSATPDNYPGDWVTTQDYPSAALHFKMHGTSGFKLTIDTTGKPSRCDIISSSGFDVLDTATCERVMARALFKPARDRKGAAIEGGFSNRVRWVLPDRASTPVSERFASLMITIDRTGKITSCRAIAHVPVNQMEQGNDDCRSAIASMPLPLGLEIRGEFQGDTVEAELQMADAFAPELRARVIAPKPGYEQRALSIHRFQVLDGGKLGQCDYEEQRGSAQFATDFCRMAGGQRFDPPFSAYDKDGKATGWHVARALRKIEPVSTPNE